ncbi:MAG: hypothetical protein IKV43_03605, partial [Clostridia bacterium]|nr:hypothetical protein [Clostridia bacterium]
IAVVGLVGLLLSAGIFISALMEATLSSFDIFGFKHALDNPEFLAFMLGLGIVLSILLNFFRARLEGWFDRAIVGRREKPARKEKQENA